MSFDPEKPKRIEINFRGTPKRYLIKLDDRYYDTPGHSEKQAKMGLGMKSMKGQKGGRERLERIKRQMRVMKELEE